MLSIVVYAQVSKTDELNSILSLVFKKHVLHMALLSMFLAYIRVHTMPERMLRNSWVLHSMLRPGFRKCIQLYFLCFRCHFESSKVWKVFAVQDIPICIPFTRHSKSALQKEYVTLHLKPSFQKSRILHIRLSQSFQQHVSHISFYVQVPWTMCFALYPEHPKLKCEGTCSVTLHP